MILTLAVALADLNDAFDGLDDAFDPVAIAVAAALVPILDSIAIRRGCHLRFRSLGRRARTGEHVLRLAAPHDTHPLTDPQPSTPNDHRVDARP